MFVSIVGFPYQRAPITSYLIPIKLGPHAKAKCTLYTKSSKLLKNSMINNGRL
jgi:hypothetical protein